MLLQQLSMVTKGANGVVNIVTKRGKYKTNEIKFTYDHAFNWEARRPKFVNAYDYAVGLNEAYANDGKSPRYSDAELGYFKSGEFPYLYPNVDWINETFKNNGSSDIYNLTFRGGGRASALLYQCQFDQQSGLHRPSKGEFRLFHPE